MIPFSNLEASSRVWVYAADRTFTASECEAIEQKLQNFTATWTAHDMPLQASAKIVDARLIVLAVNESFHAVSGCGIDKSVQLIKELGATYKVDLFNRMQVLVKKENQLVSYNKATLQAELDAGNVNEHTLVFNPMVQTLGDLEQSIFVPLNRFWMAPQLKFSVQA
ncbi:MAG: ABC transporter ATPase [Bacteroidetes bacterium B1(2017)]|nr:MAG: ABC transporter ATPase [Bacteroidetes bacterium B1(2017)]